MGELLVVEPNPSGIRPDQADDGIKAGGFACAIRA
jgi:hypothetical protein